jgi:phytol kinase
VIGKRYGKRMLVHGKSFEGSLTMFVTSFIVTFIIAMFTQTVGISLLLAMGVAAFATLIELFTPKGLDNLSVPLGSSLIFYLLLLII